jgi:hypothetical protein
MSPGVTVDDLNRIERFVRRTRSRRTPKRSRPTHGGDAAGSLDADPEDATSTVEPDE